LEPSGNGGWALSMMEDGETSLNPGMVIEEI